LGRDTIRASAWGWPRKRRVAAAILLCLVVALGIDAFWIEPYWIELTRHRVPAALSSPLKIAHLTDLHTSGVGRRERRMIRILEAERPDLIVITGDMINVTSDYPGLHDVLVRLHAPLGVWVVRGNHEDWWPVENEQEFYESAGAKMLLNAGHEVRDDVWLVGFDDLYGGSPKLDESFAGMPESAYRIALFHSPQFFEQVAGRCDLALAGHTHGGQVRLTLIGPLWLPPFSGGFVDGWFERLGTRMYVSRGVGTAILNARFWCRPEIAIITVGG
jgi:predicted MPP superfamily phosphohydrolase